VLRRERLEDLLDEAFGRRLTTVVAAPGYGKSTLVAQWAVDLDAAWYATESSDASVTVFGRGLVASLRTRVADLPNDFEQFGKLGGSGKEERRRAETFGEAFSQCLYERLSHDLLLIIDDAHELGVASASARLLETLCRQAPDTLHLVVISRAEPPFPTARMRGRGEVLELDAALLALTEGEVERLVANQVTDGAPELARALHAATAGWPAAVRLALEVLRVTAPEKRPDLVEAMRRPGGPIFSYLAEEVFGRTSDQLRALIQRVAPLERFTPELCEALGVRDAAHTIPFLARSGLLVRVHAGGDEEWYVLHSLVREFARRTRPLSEEELHDVREAAAAWFERNGRFEDALRLHADIGDGKSIARFLRLYGDRLLPDSAKSIAELGRRLSAAQRDDLTEEILSRAYFALGDMKRSLDCLERIAADRDELPPRIAVRLGHFGRDGDEAIEIYRRARLADADPADVAVLLAYWSNVHALRGEVEEARVVAGRALDAALASDDDSALANAYHALGLAESVAGDRRSATRYYEQELEPADRSGDGIQVARARRNLAIHLIEDGRCREAAEQLEVALRAAEREGVPDLIALVLSTQADALCQLGHFDAAIAELAPAKAALEDFGSSHLAPIGDCACALGDAYRERGDKTLARASYERALEDAKRIGNVQIARAAAAGLARVLAYEDPTEAERVLEDAASLGAGRGDDVLLLAAAWVALGSGDHARAQEAAAEAERFGRQAELPAVLAQSMEVRACASDERPVQARCLEEAARIWRDLENPTGEARCRLALARFRSGPLAEAEAERLRRRLAMLGVRIGAGTGDLLGVLSPEAAPAVAIRSLGGFDVLREGRLVPLREWRSKKARDLLKLLVAHHGRRVSREVLMDALWPDEDPQKLGNRLSVALSILRGVLDPEHQFLPERFIRSSGDAVSLDLNTLSVDVERFLAEAAVGLRGEQDSLELADELYAGEFLEEDAYEDWSVPVREEARATYIAVARALSERAAGAGEHEQAARYLRRILERDAFDERAHLALVSSLLAAGQHGEARRAYRVYGGQMDQIGVEAMPFPSRTRLQPDSFKTIETARRTMGDVARETEREET
jgi:DNA-binding SARP family transcriptional activator/predicted negative regulator of RcsB-dependent stress response